MSRSVAVHSLVAVGVIACLARPASAQLRASERGSVSQTVDGTVITVDYGRAQVRGREQVFGKLVTPGEVWTPGANWATTLEVSQPVTVQGHALAAGKYSMWLVTGPGDWTLYLNAKAQLFHMQPPKLPDMLLAIPVHPTTVEPTEVLTFDFPRVAPDTATLRFRWATSSIAVDVITRSSRSGTGLTDAQMAPFLGSYLLTMMGPGGPSPEQHLEIVNAKGVMRAIVDTGNDPWVFELVPTADANRFMPAFLDKGKVFDVEVTPVNFEVVAGRSVGFQVPGVSSPLWMRARRKP